MYKMKKNIKNKNKNIFHLTNFCIIILWIIFKHFFVFMVRFPPSKILFFFYDSCSYFSMCVCVCVFILFCFFYKLFGKSLGFITFLCSSSKTVPTPSW